MLVAGRTDSPFARVAATRGVAATLSYCQNYGTALRLVRHDRRALKRHVDTIYKSTAPLFEDELRRSTASIIGVIAAVRLAWQIYTALRYLRWVIEYIIHRKYA